MTQLKKIIKQILLLIYSLFFRIKYIENKEDEHKSGYYMLKREWVWIVCSPILLSAYLIYVLIIGVVDFVGYVFYYDCHWVRGKKKKLSFMERLYLIDRLMN